MAKQIAYTKAGKRIAAAIIVKNGRRIGQVLVHHTPKVTTVEVWSWEDLDNPRFETAKVTGLWQVTARAINATGIKFAGQSARDSPAACNFEWHKNYEDAGLQVWKILGD